MKPSTVSQSPVLYLVSIPIKHTAATAMVASHAIRVAPRRCASDRVVGPGTDHLGAASDPIPTKDEQNS